MESYVPGLPGIGSDKTATPRTVALGGRLSTLPGGIIIDGSESRDPLNTGDVDVLRAGILLGKRTANSLFAPSIIGVLSEAYDKDGSEATQLTVSAATATEIVRRIGTSGTLKVTGPPTAAGTVAVQTATFTSVNTTTGVIVIVALAADAIAGSFIQPTDGSETIRTMVPDGFGVKVTDEDDSDIDVSIPSPGAVVGGLLDASQIVNWPSDTSLVAYLKAALRAVGTGYVFDDDF